MRKILFATTALLAAGAYASTAQASEPIKLSLGGYMEYWVAAADQDGGLARANADTGAAEKVPTNSFDVQGDSEIWFVGKTTLDNGITVGVQVELEAGSNNNGGDLIDESYLWLEGKYGKLILGSENDVSYLSSINAPEASDLGGGIGDGDTNKFLIVPVLYADPIQSTFTGDANKVSYFTPKIHGFQGGVSYVPSNSDTGDDGSAISETIEKAAEWDEAWAFAISYHGEFSGFGVKANIGYTILDPNGDLLGSTTELDTIDDYGAGLQISYQGFTLGGSYRQVDGVGGSDISAWDLGGQYAAGPYAVSLSYTNSSYENVTVSGNDHTVDLWKLGSKYALGPGVNLFGQIAYLDASGKNDNNEDIGNEGAWGGAVGLRLSF